MKHGCHLPCTHYDCLHHLWFDSKATTRVKTHLHGDLEHTCTLDVVAQHPEGMTQEAIGDLLGYSREYIRQVETQAVNRLRKRMAGQTYTPPFEAHDISDLGEDDV